MADLARGPGTPGHSARLRDFRFEQLQAFKTENGVSKRMTGLLFGWFHCGFNGLTSLT